MDHWPLSRNAAEPNTSVAQRGDDAWNAGENVAELKLVPPAYRTVPTPTPKDASVWAAAGDAPVVPAISNASTPRFTGEKLPGTRKQRQPEK